MNAKSKSNVVKKSNQKTSVRVEKTTEAQTPGIGPGPVIVDGFLHFSRLDLVRFELAQAKVLNALQAIGLQKAKIEETKRSFELHMSRLNDEMQTLVQTSSQAENELRSLQTELQQLYQLDFSQVTYDDTSGKISLLGLPVPEEEFLSKQADPTKE